MCGIHAIISSSPTWPLQPSIERQLKSRGPDHISSVSARLERSEGSLFLQFTSTVLALRGDHIVRQPLVDTSCGSVLCWNGEAWNIQGQRVQGNDGEAVLALLVGASRGKPDGQQSSAELTILDALREIEGPFAFVFYDKPTKRLFYGRDRLGRRSLLLRPGPPLILCSIAETPSPDWAEVEADGFYSIDLSQDALIENMATQRHDWVQNNNWVSGIGEFNTKTPTEPFSLSRAADSVAQLHDELSKSLHLRVVNIPRPPSAGEADARVAVLFSGGLDCTVLARLASDLVPPTQPIDLLNVAFENLRIASQFPGKSQDELYELCPDRITGRRSFEELLKTCPSRTWHFVTVNIPYTETRGHREEIVHLLHPHQTEMDLSIANALYFAARGHGSAIQAASGELQSYTTTARVLLSGLGADELFGGYSRHGAAFSRGGYAELVNELKVDVSRLGKRNLGRDDRVMAHWEREVRFPYLDEHLVKWAIELPVWEKCDFENTAETVGLDPEKRVLRLLAQSLELDSAAKEKKRAIQFGARTAKMESGKVKGTTSIKA